MKLVCFLLMQPGLTGGSGDSYMRHMLVRARSRGWRVVVFNSRGCADSPVTTPQVSIQLIDYYCYIEEPVEITTMWKCTN